MNSLVTVVMPVAESHKFLLPRSLYSLKTQTYQPEILIVNDSEKFIDLPFDAEVIDTGGNKGSAYARNLGADNVQTPFTLFLDADDYLIDIAIETFLRAFAEYNTCYVYSDWFQCGKDFHLSRHESKTYNRVKQIRHSIHLVTTLLPTNIVREVRFDDAYRGWEDVEFYVRLGESGYCGTKIPEPLLIYDMTTSINRVKHNAIQDEVYPEILNKYKDYLEGVKEFMPCSTCGGNRPPAQAAVNVMPPAPEDGMTVLEYMGQNTAPIPFRINRTVYRGANDDAFKFIQVPYQDVQPLLDKQVWRKVPKASKPATIPTVSEFNEWRQVQPPPTPPKDWASIFQRGAVVFPQETQEAPKKRRGRIPGTKNKPKPTVEVETTLEPEVEDADRRDPVQLGT